MKNQAPPTDQALVAEYLSRGGAVTVCPPHTFAIDATRSLTHKEKLAEWRRIASRHFAGLRAKRARASPAPMWLPGALKSCALCSRASHLPPSPIGSG